MTLLDSLNPEPDLLEIDRVEAGVGAERAWEVVRHGDLGRSPIVRALFAVRTIPSRLAGAQAERPKLRIDDFASSEAPGFRILAESGREVAVGAIGKVWKLDIPFLEIRSSEEFARFAEPDFVKVVWALRVLPLAERRSRIEFELRVKATDPSAREKFRRYFRLIGPVSHFIRRSVLSSYARDLGAPEAEENERALPGDELIPDAAAQLTHGVTISASPEAIWPWLVQMGCRRAGWYSYDLLDNAGVESAREVHPELQSLSVGDVIPATPEGEDGFEVLRVEPPRLFVLGGLFDAVLGKQLPFAAERPERYWHVSWAFVLEPLGESETRLLVRARAAFSPRERLHVAWIRPAHHFMETAQLRNLKARVEDRLPRDGWRDVAQGVLGAAGIALTFLTPFLRGARSHWGLEEVVAAREYPGDDFVPEPRWSWTHAIDIEAPAESVWPWIAQIGADRGGFYSHQWLENLAGCELRNAERIHPEWEVKEGDGLLLHPRVPRLPVVRVEPGRWFVAHASAEPGSKSWAAVSWLFYLEPLGSRRCRFVSRFRSDSSDDLATRILYGPWITESIGFVMDRQMLLGVKERAEQADQRAQ